MNLQKLKDEFPGDKISWRVGSTTADKKNGLALAYIDARDVMDRLDEVCGQENWEDEYPHVGSTMVCRITIKCGDKWVSKCDGAGTTDVEAEKGQLSDAFKRSAVKWGIGRYLYEDRFKGIWVEIEPMGKSFRIKASELKKLSKLFDKKPTAFKSESNQQEPKGEKTLQERATSFSDYLDKLQSAISVANLVASNNKLLLELKEKAPVLYEEISQKINQVQEAFQLAEAAE